MQVLINKSVIYNVARWEHPSEPPRLLWGTTADEGWQLPGSHLLLHSLKSPKYPTNLCQIFQHTPQTFCRLQTYAPLYSCFINIIFPLPLLLALPVSCRVGEESWLVTLPLPWRETTSPVTQLPAASCLLPLPPCKLEATKLAPCSVCYHHAPVLLLMQNSTFLLSYVHIIEAYCRYHYFI